jgi:hypothetical protein
MAFAVPTDVTSAMEGMSPPLPSDDLIQLRLAVVEARLRLLIPDLEARIETAELLLVGDQQNDLAVLARDVVVQAAIRKLTNTSGPEAQSTTQQAGPFATTVRYRQDKSGTFPDDDLDLLRGGTGGTGSIGTIKLGAVDWVHL